jgi:glycosyltransferase involved in cell wall biosynthesis
MNMNDRTLAPKGSIAVIIPTYDRGPLLRIAVDSVLAQTRPAAEIIVVSDGAPVDPADYIGDLVEHGTVRLLTQANSGAQVARDFGARHATSDYLIFLDDDDTLLPDAFEHLGTLLDQRPDAVAAAGGTRLISRPGAPMWLPNPVPDGQYFRRLLDGNEFLGGATMMRRDAYHRAGGYDPEIRGVDDWYMNLRLAWLGPIAVHQGVVIEYFEHTGSYSSKLTQLDCAVPLARRIAGMVGPGGRVAGNHIRSFLFDMYLDPVLTQITRDLRAGRIGAAAGKVHRILRPVFLPWLSRSVLLMWLGIVRQHFRPRRTAPAGQLPDKRRA